MSTTLYELLLRFTFIGIPNNSITFFPNPDQTLSFEQNNVQNKIIATQRGLYYKR